ncbi:MAG: hypothetical protein AAGI03_06845 [Pseudomonadota bacterium]
MAKSIDCFVDREAHSSAPKSAAEEQPKRDAEHHPSDAQLPVVGSEVRSKPTQRMQFFHVSKGHEGRLVAHHGLLGGIGVSGAVHHWPLSTSLHVCLEQTAMEPGAEASMTVVMGTRSAVKV